METRYKCLDIPKRIAGLQELAYNFWWSWNSDGRLLFKRLSRTTGKINKYNPVKMLCEIDKEMLEKAANDFDFLKYYNDVMDKFNQYMNSKNN